MRTAVGPRLPGHLEEAATRNVSRRRGGPRWRCWQRATELEHGPTEPYLFGTFERLNRQSSLMTDNSCRWTEFLLPSTDIEGKPHSRIGHSPLDVFKQVNLKRFADIVSGQILDRRSNHDLVRATMPRGVGNEIPSALPILQPRLCLPQVRQNH